MSLTTQQFHEQGLECARDLQRAAEARKDRADQHAPAPSSLTPGECVALLVAKVKRHSSSES